MGPPWGPQDLGHNITFQFIQKCSKSKLCLCMRKSMFITAGIGRMGPPRKIDLFLIDHFVIFSIRTIKMYSILVDYSGNVVLKKYMHAAIYWIIK